MISFKSTFSKKALVFFAFFLVLIIFASYLSDFSQKRDISQEKALQLSLISGEKINFEIISELDNYSIRSNNINSLFFNSILDSIGYPNLDPTFRDLKTSELYKPESIKIVLADIEKIDEDKKQLLAKKTLNQGKIVYGIDSSFDSNSKSLTYWLYYHSSFFTDNDPPANPLLRRGLPPAAVAGVLAAPHPACQSPIRQPKPPWHFIVFPVVTPPPCCG